MAPSSDADADPDLSDHLGRLQRKLKAPRTLSFTRAGRYLVLLTLGVGFGAINTGNNLLFLLLGMMLSLIIASGILSEAVLRHLDAVRLLPDRLFAGRPAPGHFELDNPKPYQSLSIAVEERNPTCLSGPLAGQTIGHDPPPWWQFWRSGPDDEEALQSIASGYCLRIGSRSSTELDARYRLPERGTYRLRGLKIVTRFPFSLFEKARELNDPTDVAVYPAPRSAEEWSTRIYAAFGDVPADERGQGEEYYGLREYRPGEDRRMIHWKRSAARGELVVRENEAQEQRAVVLHVVNCTGRPEASRGPQQYRFERGLERVVGLLETLGDRGYRIGLRTLDDHVPLEVEGGRDAMLHALATLDLHDGAPTDRDFAGDSARDVGQIVLGLPPALEQIEGDWDVVLPFDGPN
jgi:uncharacterized protein (DUF58 family)